MRGAAFAERRAMFRKHCERSHPRKRVNLVASTGSDGLFDDGLLSLEYRDS